MTRNVVLKQAGLAALTGVLWVIASPPFGLWPLAWVAMVPLLWLIESAPKASTAGRHAWIAGTVMTIGGFHWMAEMVHDHGHLPWIAGVAALLVFAAYQGLAWLLAGRAIWWIRKRTKLPLALVAAVVIVGVEHAFPVLFPYTLAISQVPALRVVQIADVLGAAAITGLLVACAGAVLDRGWKTRATVGGLIVATLIYGTVRLGQIEDRRADASKVRVGLVQPNEAMRVGVVDNPRDRALLTAMQDESARLEREGATLIVWSETSYPLPLPHDLARDLSGAWRVRRGFEVPVVIGAMTIDRGRRWNTSLLIVGGEVKGRQDKVHRVLGSEYNPIGEWTGWMSVGFSGGDGPVIFELGELRLGVMICLEDTLGGYAGDVADARPNLLVNQTIDTWFGTGAEPYQHRALAQLRAIEQRADLVRSVNTGPSGLVLATGALGPQTPVRDGDVPVEGIVVEAAVMEAGHTIYGAIGDLLARLCALLAFAGWIWARRQREPVPASSEKPITTPANREPSASR